jgi:hypothetical protein
MKSFLTYQQLDEQAGKNLHLEHLEDEIINNGINGGRAAINFLRSLRDMLKGDTKSKVMTTVKWDGAPAVFFGVDPEDDQFFVAKKGIFNKNPKIYKSHADIDADTSGDLSKKLKISFDYLQKLKLGGKVYQGDLMFTDDVSTETIDGEKLLTFQPNTIVYAVPADSDLGKTINKAKIGIVIHTAYSGGPTLQDMSASFNIDVSKFGNVSGLWYQDASYKDVSGNATLTAKETTELDVILSKAGKAFRGINSKDLNTLLSMQDTMSGQFAGAKLSTFINSHIREQKYVNPKTAAADYYKYIETFMQKQIDKVKTDKAKEGKATVRDEYLRQVKKSASTIASLFAFYQLITDAKLLLVRKLESVQQLTKTFVRTDNGFKVTEPEGFVAVDKVGGQAVKLVDRLTFSYNNFTAAKNWTK